MKREEEPMPPELKRILGQLAQQDQALAEARELAVSHGDVLVPVSCDDLVAIEEACASPIRRHETSATGIRC